MEYADLQPRIVDSPGFQLVGMALETSLSDYRAAELWRAFQPLSRGIAGIGAERYHVKVFGADYDLSSPDPTQTFTIWACASVPEGLPLPEGMERLLIPAGHYGVFRHVGPAAAFPRTLGMIYGAWMPSSGYAATTERPHFEVMPPGYDPTSPDATEEIWIPLNPAS